MVTLVLRRCGRGNWSTVRLIYDPARQGHMPTAIDARIGAVLELWGVKYRVAAVLA